MIESDDRHVSRTVERANRNWSERAEPEKSAERAERAEQSERAERIEQAFCTTRKASRGSVISGGSKASEGNEQSRDEQRSKTAVECNQVSLVVYAFRSVRAITAVHGI